MAELIFPEESYQIVGAAFAVYNDKGNGFNEAIYQECMEIELGYQDIPFEAQYNIPLTYRGQSLKHGLIPDLVCYGKIIVELKAV